MHLENLRPQHVAQVVDIIRDVRLGFLSRMPRAFIHRYFENAILLDNFECRVLTDGDDVLGFYVMTIGRCIPRGAPILKSPLVFCLIAISHVFPAFVIAQYLLSERKIAQTHAALRETYDAELIYNALRNGAQNKGLGRLLMADMRHVLERRGIHNMGTEYYSDDTQAARFYAKYPHKRLGEIVTAGRSSTSLSYRTEDLPK